MNSSTLKWLNENGYKNVDVDKHKAIKQLDKEIEILIKKINWGG